MRDPEAPGQQVKRELDRLEVHVALGVLEPLQADLRRPLQALHRGRRSASYAASAAGTSRRVVAWSARARATASSMASFVPDPTEKCAVWAASPSSTTFSWCQCSVRSVPKLRHTERFVSSRRPASSSRNNA